MKRYYSAVLFTACAVLFATVAHAGVGDAVKSFISQNVLLLAVEVLLAIAGVFWAGAKIWKNAFKETLDVPLAFKKARDPKSPGGKEITSEERNTIAKEAGEAAQAIATAYAASQKKKK
jgi:hypothetical protein